MENGHAENDTGFMVNAALNGIAQCPLSGYALLEIAAVGDILYITVFIVGGAVRLNEGYMVDRRGGLDGGKHVFVFFRDEFALCSDLCSNTVQKLVVDIQNLFKMDALPGNIRGKLFLGQLICGMMGCDGKYKDAHSCGNDKSHYTG